MSRRDLSQIPQRQITFDDMCRLQEYFDQRNATNAAPFRVVDEELNETQRVDTDRDGRVHQVSVGHGTYLVTDRAARRQLRRLLREEFDRLPEMAIMHSDQPVRMTVQFWSSGPIRRLRPDMGIEIQLGNDTVSLPFNPCVGEFLFAADAYAMRRRFLENEAARARGETPPPHPTGSDADAAAPAATSDAGATTPSAAGTTVNATVGGTAAPPNDAATR